MHKRDKQFPNPLLLWGTLLLCGFCALIFYNKLENPFGGLFSGSVYGAIGGILLFLSLLCGKAIRAPGKLLCYLGFGGALLVLLAGASVISLAGDYRQLAPDGEQLTARPLPLDQTQTDAITGKYLFSSMGILSITQQDSQLFLTLDDPLEGTIFSVLTELHPVGNMAFTTDINEVGLSFRRVSDASPPQLHLYWGDSQRVLEKLPAGYKSPLELLREDKVADGIAAIKAEKANFTSGYANLERLLNDLGYQQLQQNKLENAIAIFQLNTELFPDSWNVYDSLAEAYMTSGDNARAKEFYKKALAINPNSDHSRRILDQLR